MADAFVDETNMSHPCTYAIGTIIDDILNHLADKGAEAGADAGAHVKTLCNNSTYMTYSYTLTLSQKLH